MLRETRQGRNQDPRICCFSRVSEAGILQLSARRHAKSLQSCPCVTLWTAALQPPLCIGFSRQEYWSGLPCPPPGGLPNPGMETRISEVSRTGRQVLYHCPAQSYGRLGPDNALLWGQPLQWRVLSSLPDLHPWMLVGHLSHF